MIKLTKIELEILACVLEEAKQSMLDVTNKVLTDEQRNVANLSLDAINNIARKLYTPDVTKEYKEVYGK